MTRPGELSAPSVARTLVVGLAGPRPTAQEAAWLNQWRPAGVILFSRNVTSRPQLTWLCALLHDLVPDLEITADHEGGPISHLAAAVGCPPAPWTQGRVDDLALTRAVHAETARRLAAVGVDRVLGPCADVMTNTRNPVIGVRAFGDREELVARQVEAAVQGLMEGGVSGCLKHWPGHGASGTDSHLAAAFSAITTTPAPFNAGMKAGCAAVMVGHLAARAGTLPATLDPEKLSAWRRQLQEFSADPVTLWADDVTMGALRPAMKERGVPEPDHQGTGLIEPADLPEAWFTVLREAGCDRLLVRGIPWRAFPLDDRELLLDTEIPRTNEDTLPEAPAYREVLGRVGLPLDPVFADPDGAVVWLDFTAEDRWETIVPGQAVARDVFAQELARRFTAVHREGEEAWGGSMRPLKWLVVTSHRPLEKTWEILADRPTWLATRGQALVSGHPSLETEAVNALGSGWVVKYCSEMIYK